MIDEVKNKERMVRGELYYSMSPSLVAERKRCQAACLEYNNAQDMSRRNRVKLLRNILMDTREVPENCEGEPWIEPPIRMDYGWNVKLGKDVFINFNCTILDTCRVEVGSRTLLGPNVSLFAATHPVESSIRQGINGPELGAPIRIGEDCWIGGNVIVLPGVTIGNRCVIGAGSVVTKDIPPDSVAVGNPAKVIKTIDDRSPSTRSTT